MADNPALTKEHFIERYVAHTLKTCGFIAFDDGTDVATYARESAEACWSSYPGESPEELAEGDMEYWGEE
jgi:hypothetical protein